MSNTQYAVCHLQRGSGNDSGMSCHIERKDAKGKKYVPDNADAGRTHLNRELVRFPEGVSNRTEAIQHRIDTAGLRRKVGKNQTKAIRVILTGTHEQMMEIANGGRLDSWIDANLKWKDDATGRRKVATYIKQICLQSLVEDAGRPGLSAWGVSRSGAGARASACTAA